MNPLNNKAFVGFPSGLLVDRPLRIPVIAQSKEWIALNKPAGIAIRQHPWNHGMTDLDTALNRQLKAQKPELMESGATLFGSIYNIEPEISGVALFAKHRNALGELRNLAGSEKLEFKFLLVAKSGALGAVNELTADAPLLAHNTKPKMIPSTAKGKKACTYFLRMQEGASGWSLWTAVTQFPRLHQVRSHAFVEGIEILGDSLYSSSSVPLLSELMPKKKSTVELSRPIFDGIAVHLIEVLLPVSKSNPEAITLRAALPRHLKILLDRLNLKYSD
jgi:tRNA pseudouridine32 synthase/23S rRNA pseudouridine746 synthase